MSARAVSPRSSSLTLGRAASVPRICCAGGGGWTAWAGTGGSRRRFVQIQREAERQRNRRAGGHDKSGPDAERAHRAYERAQTAEANASDCMWSLITDVELLNEELQDDVARCIGYWPTPLRSTTPRLRDPERSRAAADSRQARSRRATSKSRWVPTSGADRLAGSSARCPRKVPCQMG